MPGNCLHWISFFFMIWDVLCTVGVFFGPIFEFTMKKTNWENAQTVSKSNEMTEKFVGSAQSCTVKSIAQFLPRLYNYCPLLLPLSLVMKEKWNKLYIVVYA